MCSLADIKLFVPSFVENINFGIYVISAHRNMTALNVFADPIKYYLI